MEKTISLNGLWHGVALQNNGEVKFEFSGSVPGCVHTDLSDNTIDYDIFYRDNADKCQWIEELDWEYTKSFTIHNISGKEELVFEGLDVYCDVYLNGIHLGYCDDMFYPHNFYVGDKLSEGENTIKVVFYSPIRTVENKEKLSGAFTTERLHTRRIQCTYGWDWVARFVTCGIFRDTYIRIKEGCCTKNLYVYTEHIGKTSSQIAFEAEFENFADGEIITAEITSPEGEKIYSHDFYIKENFLRVYVDIKNAKLWYPHGYGEQPLYTLSVGNKSTSFGIRTVRILEEKDEIDSEYYNKCLELKESPSAKEYDHNKEFSGFVLLINDTAIMCKGANWVPCEPFPSAESDDKITKILELSKIAGVNMVRVWGGGVFEKEHFYNECDRLGITVTQDFLMACGAYPEDDPDFIEKVKKEAEYAALTLRNHPSLVWWSGDNENAIKGSDEQENYKGRAVTHKSIMPILNQFDPRRRFLLSSPYGGNFYASKTVGTTHNSQYLSYIFKYIFDTDMGDYKEYFKNYTARFITEEPTMGAASTYTLRKMMNDDDIYNGYDIWLYHTKGNPGLKTELFDYLLMFTEKVLGNFKDGYDRLFKLKYIQYEWVRTTFELARRNKGFCNGIIFWMLNDCWPAAASWSIIDYYALPKPSFYSFKRCAKPIIASLTNNGDNIELYISNDTLCEANVKIKAYSVSGSKTKIIAETNAAIDANSTRLINEIKIKKPDNNSAIICDINGENICDRAFYKNGALIIGKANAISIVNQTEDSITVSSDAYIHAIELEGEYIFEDNYFSLIPGEVKTVKMKKYGENSEVTVLGYTV